MAGPLKHSICCPGCYTEGRKVPLMTQLGRVGYFCETGKHTYLDTSELKAMNPPPFELPKTAKPQVPEGAVEMRVLVDSKLQNLLQQRFGNRLNSVVSGVLMVLAQESSFVIGDEDVGRIREILGGKQVKSSGELVGTFRQMAEEVKDLKEAMEKLRIGSRAASSFNGGGIRVELEPAALEIVESKAKFNNTSVAEYISVVINNAAQNGWL